MQLPQCAWQQLSQAFLDRSVVEWRRRLENVLQCNGGRYAAVLVVIGQIPPDGGTV